jgi:ribosomal protein S25
VKNRITGERKMRKIKANKSKKLMKNAEDKGQKRRRKIGSKRYEAMKAKLMEILKEEGIVTTESFARICNCSYNVARDWLHTFERDGFITFLAWMRGGKIYKLSAINHNCGISLSHNQEEST